MNSLFVRFDKLFIKQLFKPNYASYLIISKSNYLSLNYRNVRNYSNTCNAFNSFKSKRKNSNRYAIYSFTAAISLAKIYEIIGINENKEVKKLIHKAKQHLEDGEVDEATEVYNNALKVAIDTQDQDDVYFIKEQLAVIAFFLKRYDDAERLFIEVKDYFVQKGLQITDLKIAYINLKLAELYDFLKNDKKAIDFYKLCSKGLKKKITDALHNKDDEVIELWIMSLTSRAHFFLNRGNFEKAYKYFKKAHEACVHIQGELNEQAVTLLQQLGAVCFQTGDLEAAVEYLKKATELGKHLPGMIELSNVYVTLGNIYLRQGFFKDAEGLCSQGLKNALRHDYQEGVEEANACLEELKRATSLS